jgi:DNA-binding MarR family transcriptional regulator
MTKRLKRLEAAKLIRRTPSRGDRRSSEVALTAKGRQVVEEAVAAHVRNENRLLAGLDGDERATLAKLLRTLSLHLEEGDG